MAQSNDPSNIIHPNGLLQDTQGRWQRRKNAMQNVQHNQHRTGLETKRKRQEINEEDIQISRSSSQLSIS
ncbi:unnamed protein product [Rotaria sordida]|uniref:Uncharacterized protein n=1 Tax=Rotaria sordida TaxID=392033 RepID=A0A820E9H7_9BILA|nr:unnamed protein product [Rotaria sordida]